MTGQKLVSLFASHRKEDLVFLRELVEAGKVTPVIDRRYPLREVPDAIRYVGTRHARAEVVSVVEECEEAIRMTGAGGTRGLSAGGRPESSCR